MTNHTKHKLASWQFLLLFIASFGTLTGLGNLTSVQPFLSANIAKASESEASVKQKLIGRWRGRDHDRDIDIVFTPEGKLFFLPISEEYFEEWIYKVDISLNPNHLYLLMDNRVVRNLEFELSNEKLIVYDHTERPIRIELEKISSETKLETSKIPAKEHEAKMSIATINRTQQAFYFEKARFANANVMNKSNELGVQIQSKYYNFKTSAKNDNAISLATAKDPKKYKLRNYAGITFVSRSDQTFSSIICVSNEIGGKVVPASKNGKVYCAVGKEVKR